MRLRWIAALFFFFYIGLSSVAQAGNIVVVGKGEVEALPDRAEITLSVTGVSKDAAEAQKRNRDTNKKIEASLFKLGIDDKSTIRSLMTFNDVNYRDPKVKQYTAHNTLRIVVSNFELLPQIVSLAVANGAVSQGAPDYSLSNDAPLREEARRRAYAMAKEEAEKSASVLGVKLGRVVKVSVGPAALAGIIGSEMIFAAGGGMSKQMNFEGAPTIEPIKVDYIVTIEFELIEPNAN